MIVSELIEMLNKMPQNAIVASDGCHTWLGEHKILAEREVKNRIYMSEDKKYLLIDMENCDY